MNRHKVMMVVHIVLALVSFYAFAVPDLFGFNGYTLAVDGVVVARELSFLFALYSAGQAVKEGLSKDD